IYCTCRYPAYDRLPPCPSKDDPPRMEHLVAREDEVAGDFISRSLNLPPIYNKPHAIPLMIPNLWVQSSVGLSSPQCRYLSRLPFG
uniref:Uncharacterized protein n=1 Tax=Aegilops tauschii subsp. strangulata TaxID=200361 RepID=A0A453ATH4_AEGTS